MTTRPQIEAFRRVNDDALQRKALVLIERSKWYGLNADECFAKAFPGRGFPHTKVDSFRVAIHNLRRRGKVKDSGVERPSPDSGVTQTVWVVGDDRDVLEADRRRKLTKLPTSWLIDELHARLGTKPRRTYRVKREHVWVTGPRPVG